MSFSKKYRKISLIGQGAYGRVYEVQSPSGEHKALKCHLKNKEFDFNLCVRELDINNALSLHPNILPLTQITVNDPFINCSSPLTGDCAKYVRETIGFVYPLAVNNLNKFVTDKANPVKYDVLKNFMMEILLGVEYMHKCGYIHRDIKPDNVMIIKDKASGKFIPKIGDFGLAKTYVPNIRNTPGVTTSWFRSPEVCLGYHFYGFGVDMWAVGCTFYQIISGSPLFIDKRNENNVVLNMILNVIPYVQDVAPMRKYDMEGILNQVTWRMTEKPYNKFFNLSDSFVKMMEATKSMKIYYDFMFGLLCIDPEKRLTATAALNHDYFKSRDRRNTIESVREACKPIIPERPPARIHNLPIRNHIVHAAIALYTTVCRKTWCPDIVLFHAVYLFDKIIDYSLTNNDSKFITSNTPKFDMEIYFIECVYYCIKFSVSMLPAKPFADKFPKEYSSDAAKKTAGRFEDYLLRTVCKYTTYSHTVFEEAYSNERLSEEDLYSVFILIVSGHHNGKTPAETYEFWKKHRAFYREKSSTIRAC